MTDRRSVLKLLGTALGVGAAGAGIKVVDAPRDGGAFLIVTVPPGYEDPDDGMVARLSTRIEKLTGLRVLVFPHGTEVRCSASGMVYQRERLGDYEYEFAGKTEEDLKARLEAAGL